MNSASNMIAKWYQSAMRRAATSAFEKMLRHANARLGAPPVRDRSVCSRPAREGSMSAGST
jgi:hypothetical protein